jgi:hypothetical protein
MLTGTRPEGLADNLWARARSPFAPFFMRYPRIPVAQSPT